MDGELDKMYKQLLEIKRAVGEGEVSEDAFKEAFQVYMKLFKKLEEQKESLLT